MQRQPRNLLADLGQLTTAHRAQSAEELDRGVKRDGGRRGEPLQVPRIAAPCHYVEYHRRQIDPVDLRLGMRPQPISLIPEPAHLTGCRAPGSTGSLIGRVL